MSYMAYLCYPCSYDSDAGDDYFVDKEAALEYIKILEDKAKELDKT